LSRREDIKLVKEITDGRTVGVRTTERPKNRWRDEVMNELKKPKLRNWSFILKDRKVSNDLVQKTKVVYGCSVRRRRKISYPVM
jgi:hypothetical protein